jgi:hypothetical protein
LVGQIKLALAENAFNLLRVDDLLFTRLDHPARMHLADLNVNVNQEELGEPVDKELSADVRRYESRYERARAGWSSIMNLADF